MREMCLLIDRATHMTLLVLVVLMSCHAGVVGLKDYMTLGFHSYLHGRTFTPCAYVLGGPWTFCVLQLA